MAPDIFPGHATKPVILIVPGWTNSGPGHWQTHWEAANPGYRRVIQRDWDLPEPDEWIATLDAAIAEADRPAVVVAHSLGCIAFARWIATASPASQAKTLGAFLVAPSDIDRPDAPAALRSWRPVPDAPLPVPTMLVASRSDDYLAFDRAQALAGAWGSELVDAGEAGHINAAGGYGPWPEGHRWLIGFIDRVRASTRPPV